MAENARSSAGRVVELATAAIATIIVAHIVFVLVGANGANSIVSTDADWASSLAAWFRDLFTPRSAKLAVVLNYGLAALFYLAIGRIAATLVSRV
jgi:hypothetical protein